MFSIYKGKTVLVTGHTGFKGSWLTAWLYQLGAKVVGVSWDIPSEPSNFVVSTQKLLEKDIRADVRDSQKIRDIIDETQPDFIFHLAAQALVRPSYENPLETISINAIGTASVLDALRTATKNVVAIMITSDKAYDNVEWVWGYKETDLLGGKDPYSASKGMAELAIKTYVSSYFDRPDSKVRVGITRAGNVIGGGDWALDRIVPDCMVAWSKDDVVDIRSPNATRPWQHVLEPLSGYLRLGEELYKDGKLHGQAYNFGPPANQDHSVKELIDEMSIYWDNIRWNDTSEKINHVHEAGLLKLNCDKAQYDLKWHSTLKFSETVRMTVEWYRAYYTDDATEMSEFTLSQIDEYMALVVERDMAWAKP